MSYNNSSSSVFLKQEVQHFTNRLNTTFDTIWNESPFSFTENNKGKYLISTGPKSKLELSKGKQNATLSGRFEFTIDLDSTGKFISVHKSKFSFFVDKSTNPLFRYEFDKIKGSYPRSHFHLHSLPGDRLYDETKPLMKNKNKNIKDMHFPMGGDLLRPCLEDVILACDNEFNIGLSKSDRKVLIKEIYEFRLIQAKTVIRKYGQLFGPTSTDKKS